MNLLRIWRYEFEHKRSLKAKWPSYTLFPQRNMFLNAFRSKHRRELMIEAQCDDKDCKD